MRRCVVWGLGMVLLSAGGPEPQGGGSRPAAEAPRGGQNLSVCAVGIGWLAQGDVTSNPLLELAGGAMVWLGCR